jgi:hypothetical protein
MKINFDTKTISEWCASHLDYLIPAAFIYVSWYSATKGTNIPVQDGLSFWYGFMSLVSGLMAVCLWIRWVIIVLKIDLSVPHEVLRKLVG